MSLSVSNAKESLENLQHCVMAVSAWMTESKLKFNPSKTEFLLIETKILREKLLNNFPCSILGQDSNPYASAKQLGVVFDSSLNFRKHTSQTCRACFQHIRDLRRIRKRLSLDLAKQIAVALVSSKLDYCNSLFYNIPVRDIARLQRVQNCLARVVTKAPRFSRSTPILKQLHWLPVKSRIHFKICTITFRTLKDNQPAYLADLLVLPVSIVGASVTEKWRARPQTARARISYPVSGGQCHLNHLTILRRFSWPSLAYMCTKVA